MKIVFVAIALVIGLVLAGAQFGMLSGRRPADLGVKDGRLKPPSLTRNSVSSQADGYADHPQRAYATIEPLPSKRLSATDSLQVLERVLSGMPGIVVIERRPDYMHAEAQTRWLKFVDDLEFWANSATGQIEVRSASRLGREDFGVNRQRIESIRAAYLAAP